MALDLYRAAAIILMIIFHFTYDLNYFGFVELNTTRVPFWVHLRTFIVTLFMSAVGMSLYLAYAKRFDASKLLKRLLLLGAASTVITAGSLLMFPESWIYFGVLHMIFVASLIGVVFVRVPYLSGMLGIVVVALYATGSLNMHPLFDLLKAPLDLPRHTEDLAPFIPWFGVVLIGIAVMKLNPFAHIRVPQNALTKKLAFAGRHSLLIYLVHQPVLFAFLGPLKWVSGNGI
jgi:uncharacterized membrane protein